jgi:hypothetical protein
MYDNQDNDLLNRADCVPSLFTAGHPLNERDTECIVENELGCFKVDTTFGFVGLFFALSQSTRIYIYSIVHTNTWCQGDFG